MQRSGSCGKQWSGNREQARRPRYRGVRREAPRWTGAPRARSAGGASPGGALRLPETESPPAAGPESDAPLPAPLDPRAGGAQVREALEDVFGALDDRNLTVEKDP